MYGGDIKSTAFTGRPPYPVLIPGLPGFPITGLSVQEYLGVSEAEIAGV
jgi:hypothetical protein